jgi:hypothetical protein
MKDAPEVSQPFSPVLYSLALTTKTKLSRALLRRFFHVEEAMKKMFKTLGSNIIFDGGFWEKRILDGFPRFCLFSVAF